ncbi:sulfurtransferase complex subunit TusB [Orbaceae bacterium ESL0721]|nr:sulfurtransferase complex subunit TusB [Orbaceae bacterium ESL0721]
MLHTLSSSQINLQMISKTDVILFWQNGIEVALIGNPLLEEILKRTGSCYCLESDVIARGVTAYIDKRVKIITMQQVVELTAHHFPQINWDK